MGYELPEELHPETISFCIEVPNERFYRQAFWGALWTLTRPYNHADDDDHTALEVAAVWRDLWFSNRSNFEDGECMPDECCDTTNELLSKIYTLLKSGMTAHIMFNGDNMPPDFAAGDCAPGFFDHDDDETDPDTLIQREKALCLTVERYIKALLMAALVEMGAPASMISWIEDQLPSIVPPQLTKIQVVYPSILTGLGMFQAIISGGISLDLLVCEMVDALKGEMRNTLFNFKNSVNSNSGEALLNPLAAMIESSNEIRLNYTLFNQALQFAYTENLDDYECPCEPDEPVGYCDEPISLFVSDDWSGSTGTVITMVEPGIYHVVQNTAVAGVYYAAIEESTGRCLRFEIPSGYTYQAVQVFNSKGCCDDTDSSAVFSDFVGGLYKSVQWAAAGNAPIDTYLQITCEDCCPELELEDFAGTGCLIQYMGDCIWRFTNSTIVEVGDQDRYYYSFRSITGECLEVANSDVAAYPTQGVGTDTTTVDCDDVEANFSGGFTPGECKSAKWFGAQPQYFKIRPA